jgi:HD-like signal output (HDOD) protein
MRSREAELEPVTSRIARLTEIAPPPRAAQRLLDLLGREDLEIDHLSAEVERVPPIAARVVGIAGSAYFGSPAPVRSVKDDFPQL